MNFFKCNCNFKENKSRFRTALLDTQVSKMLDLKKKKPITANIPMIQTKFLQIHVLQMASESIVTTCWVQVMIATAMILVYR